MRRLWITALLAVPVGFLTSASTGNANPPDSRGYGWQGIGFQIFPHIHQHGPLFNYGPYYGYYPFKPYGPWDAYLRYDPFFYGDPYANWNAQQKQTDTGNMYGRNQNLPAHHAWLHRGGFWHASWLHGGWFRGHTWLTGGHGHSGGCSSCGGGAVTAQAVPAGDAVTRYSGFGSPGQSAVYYPATPMLDPMAELLPTAGQTR